MNASWTYCNEVLGWKTHTEHSRTNGLSNSVVATFTSLLSDASLNVCAKAYDHKDLKVGYPHSAAMGNSLFYW